MSSPDGNENLTGIIFLVFAVVALISLLAVAVVWLKKKVGGAEQTADEKPDDRKLLSDLQKLKAEMTPEVFRAFQRVIVAGDRSRLPMIASALRVALERGGENPGFGNILLTLGIDDPSEAGRTFLVGALQIYEKKFGADDPETITTLAVAARTLARHNSPLAGPLLERAMQTAEPILKPGEMAKLRATYEAYIQSGPESATDAESTQGAEQ